jgi:hypothetical protein
MRKILSPSPSCRCSACVLEPVSSHGVHMIGIYTEAYVLDGYRGRINVPRGVWYTWENGLRQAKMNPIV